MNSTKLHGSQIAKKSIRCDRFVDNLSLELSQLQEGAELLKRNGSVALTGDLQAANHKITQIADGVDGKDAVNKGQLDATIQSLPIPMVYKGQYDATAGVLPTLIVNGNVYVVKGSGAFNGEAIQEGAELIAKVTKCEGVTAADFDIVNRIDQVISVNGKKGSVELEIEDLKDTHVTTVEVNQLASISGNVQALLDSKLDDSQLITDATLASADDITIASSRVVKQYVDTAKAELQNAVNKGSSGLTQEIADRKTADDVLGARLTRLEGDSCTAGSVAKQVKDAADIAFAVINANKSDAENKIAAEKKARETTEQAIQASITDLSGKVDANKTDIEDKLAAAKAELQSQINASAPVFVDEITPVGVINGVEVIDPDTQKAISVDGNNDFTLPDVPVAGSLKLHLNGVRYTAGVNDDYTIVAEPGTGLLKVIRFAVAPLVGDKITADYRK